MRYGAIWTHFVPKKGQMWGKLNNATSPTMTHRSEMQSTKSREWIMDLFVFFLGRLYGFALLLAHERDLKQQRILTLIIEIWCEYQVNVHLYSNTQTRIWLNTYRWFIYLSLKLCLFDTRLLENIKVIKVEVVLGSRIPSLPLPAPKLNIFCNKSHKESAFTGTPMKNNASSVQLLICPT